MSRTSRVIGNNNQLLWHIPDDLKRFKVLTLGHPIIMGRKTFESILAMLGKPLPGRTNIVLTREQSYAPAGAIVAPTLDEAITLATKENPAEIHIGGGAEVYRQALPLVSRLHVTYIDDEPIGDTFFPDFSDDFTVAHEYPKATHNTLTYQWVDYIRKN